MSEEKKKEFQVKGEDLLATVKNIVREGNVRRIIIKNEKGETFMEIPLSIGLVGALAAPMQAALGALAAMAGRFTVEIVRKVD